MLKVGGLIATLVLVLAVDLSGTEDLRADEAPSSNILHEESKAEPVVRAIPQAKSSLVYQSVDGVELVADFHRPQIEGRLPVVLLIHGGGWVAGTRHQILIHANRLTAAGFAVFNIEYRLAPRFKFPAQLDDVRAAIGYLEDNADQLQIDINQLVIWGYSAGGHLAALAAVHPLEDLSRPKVCVAGGAPCDFTNLPDNNQILAPFLGGSKLDLPAVYEAASPTTHASQDDPPTFFIHGDSDLLVPHSNSETLFAKLLEFEVPTERYIAKHQGHMATFLNPYAVDAAIDFVRKHLPTQLDDQQASVEP